MAVNTSNSLRGHGGNDLKWQDLSSMRVRMTLITVHTDLSCI
jgi:hypothetical protein